MMPPISASAGGGGPSGASSNSGVSTGLTSPFVFDHSGWNVSVRSSGYQSATGSTGAGATPAASSTMNLLLMAAAAWLLFA